MVRLRGIQPSISISRTLADNLNTKTKQVVKRTVLRALTRAFGNESGRVVLPTLSGPARGLWFELDLNQFIEPAYFLGNYERNEVRTIVNICREGSVIWDCGIYLGYYTTLLSKLVGPSGRVVAFEPDPRNIKRTQQNLARNGFSGVQFVHAAIGGAKGEIDFIISNDTNSHIPGAYIGRDYEDYSTRERFDDSIRVRCMSLDEAYASEDIPNPDLIKLDIEGAEMEALPNAHRICREHKPLIILELHNPDCDAAAWEFSRAVHYQLQSLDTGQLISRKEDVTGTVLCSPQ